MVRRMRPIFFFLAIIASATIPVTVCAQTQSSTAAHVASAVASIVHFERTGAVPDLEAALKQLELANAGTQRSGDREKILAGYVKLFGSIDRGTPRLSRGKLPTVNVVPPKVNGVAYPSGVDPSAIPDPKARARYQEEIRVNDALTDRYIAAMSLHRLDERALNLFSAFARNAYGKSSADQREFRRQIEQTDLTAPRKSKLLTAVPNA
jgi:hypothetical protein